MHQSALPDRPLSQFHRESIASVLECDGDTDEPDVDTQFLRTCRRSLENLEAIDTEIRDATLRWSPDRLGKVELAILRLGVYEILHRPDIPEAVTVNEAVELAKVRLRESARLSTVCSLE